MTDVTPTGAEKKPDRVTQGKKKWGGEVWGLGYTQLPSLLLRAQNRLGLSSAQLNVLLHLCEFWWSQERRPYPSKAVIANRIGIEPKQVQRILRDLEKRGYIQRNPRYNGRAQTSNEFDLTGLTQALKKLAPEFKQVDDEARSAKRTVERKGGKNAFAAAASAKF